MELVELVGGPGDGETFMVTVGRGFVDIVSWTPVKLADVVGDLVVEYGLLRPRAVRYVRTDRKSADGYRWLYDLVRV